MATAQTAEQTPATPEEIWAILRETAKRQKEAEAESAKQKEEYDKRQAEYEKDRQRFDKLFEESRRKSEEADRRFYETMRKIDESNKKMGGLDNSFGEIVEHLVTPGIDERFGELGFFFDDISHDRKLREKKQVVAEIDLLLENGECVMAVEIKAKMKTDDVEKHVARLEKMRGYYDRRGDARKLHGAMAGAVFGDKERAAAFDAGFYVIVQTGDTMRMDVPEGFKPREW